MGIERRYQELVEKLRQEGCRLTPQRLALLRLLLSSEGHPSASQLYEQLKEQFPTTSPATVYKTLALLKSMGEAHELGFSDDDNRYDARFMHPHPHLICTHCRNILDVELGSVQTALQDITELADYQIHGYRLDFYGICPTCQDEMENN